MDYLCWEIFKNEQIQLDYMFSSSILYPRDDFSKNHNSSTNRSKIFYSLWRLPSFMFNRYRCLISCRCYSTFVFWEDNIKMDLQEVGGSCGDWMELAQDRNRWRALVSMVINLRVPKMRGIS